MGARPPRQRLLVVLAASSLAVLLTIMGVVGWALYRWRHVLQVRETAADDGENATKRAGLVANKPSKSGPPTADDDDGAASDVPRDTRTRVVAAIEVVDLGISSAALEQALRAQSALATAKGQSLLMMTTASRCAPCRGVDEALSDPAMHRALAGVRLVRVDLDAFREELAALRFPTDLYPAFFLLGPELRPLDGIHGGEWDEDIAANIAPVLGAFAGRRYHHRRHEWSPITGGIAL